MIDPLLSVLIRESIVEDVATPSMIGHAAPPWSLSIFGHGVLNLIEKGEETPDAAGT